MQRFDKKIESLEEYYDNIEDHHDLNNFFYEDLKECYKIVEDFIKRNDCILVGGMAIDFALKEKGSFLYSKNKIDYDFITPDYHTAAYELGNMLAKKFDDISVIGALHTSTLRVRYKFISIADVTYVPQILYSKIDSVEFGGFRVVHPNFQMIDQIKSIVCMAENPPRESFFGGRLPKDVKRFVMLGDFYPIAKQNPKPIEKKVVPLKYLENGCLGGLAALAYKTKEFKLPFDLGFSIENENAVISIPSDSAITIMSYEPEALISMINPEEKKKYRALLDKLPERYELVKNGVRYEIFDMHPSYILAEKNAKDKFHVLHLYGILMYLLVYKAFVHELSYTGDLFELIYKDHKSKLQYFPTAPIFYGINNWSETYLISSKRNTKEFKGLVPRNAYPKKDKPIGPDAFEFDPTKSEVLEKNGQEF